MTKKYLYTCLIGAVAALLLATTAVEAKASTDGASPEDTLSVRFSVGSFKILPNDVSAFITPVHDLNNDACALLKVVASPDFAFSSPLGIVKRKDEVGEIWLYLPNGTKLITIKHPQYGVLRNYRLPKPLEGHVTYEMAIKEPPRPVATDHDTVIITKTVTDTITIRKSRPRLPTAFYSLLTASFSDNGTSWGIMAAVMRRHGVFIHAATDFNGVGKTRFTCNGEGFITGEETRPYYTGKTHKSNLMITAGAIHRLWKGINLFEGVGYGQVNTAWQLAESEGGGYAINRDKSHKGVAAEAGLLLTWGKLCVSASAATIKGKQWMGCVGVGIKL